MSLRNRVWKLLLALALALALGLGSLARAAEPGHAHGHGTPGGLSLDHGRKWATDEALRRGMGNVRSAMAGVLVPIHEGRLPPAKYDALAAKVEGEVGYIVANCRLGKEADAQLHIVIAQLLEGIDAMKGKGGAAGRRDGALRVIDALDAYGRHFDHTGWKPLGH